MTTRAAKVRAPRPKTPKTKASADEVKAKLTQAGQAAVEREVKKLDAKRAASNKTNAKDEKDKLTPEQRHAIGAANLAKGRAAKRPTGDTVLGDGSGSSVPGVKNAITAQKLRLMATTGMTPLEFLTAVYRDQLYQDYDVEVVDEAKGLAQFFPKIDPVTGELATTKVELKIEQRIAAATSAAPYVHRKKPIGIDGGEGKPLAVVTADRLAQLSNGELDNLLQVFGKLGVGAEFEGGAQRPYGIEAEDNQ